MSKERKTEENLIAWAKDVLARLDGADVHSLSIKSKHSPYLFTIQSALTYESVHLRAEDGNAQRDAVICEFKVPLSLLRETGNG